MRVAFISDIHGNFTALEAVLADIQSQKVDQIICLGDVTTLGPQPKEVLDTLKNLNCIFIKGNHDSALLDPSRAAEYEIASHLLPDLLWCQGVLSEDELDFIDSFRENYEFVFPNQVKVFCFHGSPLTSTDLLQSTTPSDVLEEYFKGQTATIFIGGHSHIQMHRRYGNKLILNSGSVGNAFEFAFSPGVVPKLLPWAEYAILSQSENNLDVDLRRVYYDTEKLKEVVKKSGLPGSAWWIRQFQD
ncbi:MAG: metallophosphoesterase family protein [Anaerolineales bacterium]